MNDIVYIDHMKIADVRRRHLIYANEQSTHHKTFTGLGYVSKTFTGLGSVSKTFTGLGYVSKTFTVLGYVSNTAGVYISTRTWLCE
jgi:hypothetical protein